MQVVRLIVFLADPRLAPWAAFLRRFAAENLMLASPPLNYADCFAAKT
jgi:hypothetical protein